MRSVAELLVDPSFNQAPKKTRTPSAFNIFCDTLRNEPNMPRGKHFLKEAAERYRVLLPEKRAVLQGQCKETKQILKEKHTRESLEYELDAQPITPFVLFCKAEVQKGNLRKCLMLNMYSKFFMLFFIRFLLTEKRSMKALYRNLPDEEKIKYISQSVNEVGNQSNHTIGSLSFLSKDELRIMHGTTSKTTPNAYNLFVKEFCQTNGKRFQDAAQAYRTLDPAEKLKFQEMAEGLKVAEKQKKDVAKVEVQIKSEIKSEKEVSDRKSEKKKRKSEPDNSWADDSFKSPTKPAPHAAHDTSSKSNGTPSKRRKTISESSVDVVRKIKVEKERPTEPERVPT